MIAFGIILPPAQNTAVSILSAAQPVFNDARNQANQIQDANVRADSLSTVNNSADSIVVSSESISIIFKYLPWLVIIVIALILTVYALSFVQVGQAGLR